ncbi:MAG: hypothetical protein IID44_12630 [Planctomycetes bacterium]|nr:hypothetical protein [Planctomycetota bacterium]
MDDKMPGKKKQPQTPLPKSWDKYVKSAILHVFALARYALIYSRSWAADSSNQRAGLKVERDRWQQEAAQLREAMRIKDARMAQLAPQRRLHYAATERMAILELRATRSWSREQAAREFLGKMKIAQVLCRAVGEHGSIAIVEVVEVVERFILTLKNEGTRRYLVSLRRETFRHELVLFIDWYTRHSLPGNLANGLRWLRASTRSGGICPWSS